LLITRFIQMHPTFQRHPVRFYRVFKHPN
jgi:hypothetical protein